MKLLLLWTLGLGAATARVSRNEGDVKQNEKRHGAVRGHREATEEVGNTFFSRCREGAVDGIAQKRSADLCSYIAATSSFDALKDENSPQSKATEWLMHEDDSGHNANQTIIERYALSIFYFTMVDQNVTVGNGTVPLRKWMTKGESTCDWEGITCSTTSGNIEEIVLPEKNLHGSLPKELSSLTKLKKIDLFSNGIQGAVPDWISDLGELEHLDLSRNQLVGDLPDTFHKLTQLRYIDLSGNQIEGEIPTSLYSVTTLENLYLNQNMLNGTLSGWGVANWTNLTDLRLNDNKLSGSIPSTFEEIKKSIRWLILGNNRFSGSIPPSVFEARLFYIDFSNNNLTGTIPTEVRDAGKLRHLYLDHNQLTGKIPSGFASLGGKMNSLVLNDNLLTGNVPYQLGSLVELNQLLLQNNKISQKLSWDVCKLSALVGLETVALEADCDICRCDTLCNNCNN